MEDSNSQEYIRCPLCDQDESEVLFLARDRLMSIPGSYRIVQCQGCRLVYVNPRPPVASLGEYYVADLPIRRFKPVQEEQGVKARFFAFFAKRQSMFRIGWIERHIGPFRAGSRVLDVGCGTGSFLYWLRHLRKCETWGVDFSPDVVGYVREQLGIPIIQGTLDEAELAVNSFDWVTMWYLMEHDPLPFVTLKKAQRVVNPGGHLVLETPNFESLSAKLFKHCWLQFSLVPRHLVFYSPATLEALLSQCGFRVTEISHVPLVGSFLLSVLFALGVEGVGRKIDLSARHLLAFAAVTLALPLLFVAGLFVPEGMRIVAQKIEGSDA